MTEPDYTQQRGELTQLMLGRTATAAADMILAAGFVKPSLPKRPEVAIGHVYRNKLGVELTITGIHFSYGLVGTQWTARQVDESKRWGATLTVTAEGLQSAGYTRVEE